MCPWLPWPCKRCGRDPVTSLKAGDAGRYEGRRSLAGYTYGDFGRWTCSGPRKLPKDLLLDSLKVGWVVLVMENDRWLSMLLRLLRWRVGMRGDDPGRFITVGESVSATY